MNRPPWVGDPSSLVLVDLSWWLHRSTHGVDGVFGMMRLLTGWICAMLGWEPAHLAICLDSPGETWRHAKRHPTDETWRYKAHRDPKPPEFYSNADKVIRLCEMHGIPILWADRFEADDVIATATRQAREAGYRVWICSGDKDLHQLVEDDAASGLLVGMWNPFPSDTWEWRGPAAAREAFGVEPSQIADWLAIAGDKSDGVPGVGHDLGPTKAAAILAEHGTLAAALAAAVWSSTKSEEIEDEIKVLAKTIAKKTGAEAEDARIRRTSLMLTRKVASWHLVLKAHAELARFSRELTALDVDAPVDVPFEDIPIGGYQVEDLRQFYLSLGFTRKAAEVPRLAKRSPWRMPWRGAA